LLSALPPCFEKNKEEGKKQGILEAKKKKNRRIKVGGKE
jgi:hypothetical protein